MSRETIARLTRDIDRAMDDSNIAGHFAVATTLACGLVRAMGFVRAAYESKHAARTCDTEKLRALRSEALKKIDSWSACCTEIIARMPRYSGQRGSPAAHECYGCLRALIDVGWVYAVDRDADTNIDITRMRNSDVKEDGKEDDQEK